MKIRAKLKDVVIIPETPFEMNETKRLVLPLQNDENAKIAIDIHFDYERAVVTAFKVGGILPKEEWENDNK